MLPPATQKPDPRSSFSFHPHDSGAILYGGYSRVKGNTAVGKQTKGGQQTSKSVMKPTIHQDTWFLRVIQPSSDVTSNTAPNVRWERRKKPANAPNPPRAGVTQAYHKGRGISFGGVHDVEESEEGIESEFFNQLFALNLEPNRFFPLPLRRSRAAKKQTDDRGAKRNRGKADEAELLRNLSALETNGSIADPEIPVTDSTQDRVEDFVPAKVVLNTMPHPRFNAQLAVQGDILYIFGGTYEHGDREYTFDEMYGIDLGKLDGVREIYRHELDKWLVDDVDEESDSDEDEESEDDSLDDGSSGVALSLSTNLTTPTDTEIPARESLDAGEEEPIESTVADGRPHPRPFETLRDFFARTSTEWQQLLLDMVQNRNSANDQSVKELRKVAFESAEAKWWDCREEIVAEEERQEEAGIGDVVNIADRSTDTGTSGRRR